MAALRNGSSTVDGHGDTKKQRSCTMVYRTDAPWYQRMGGSLMSILRFGKVRNGNTGPHQMGDAALHNHSTMYNTAYSHTIPMAAYCCQLPGMGAPVRVLHWGMQSEVTGVSPTSQPGDLLRMMFHNDRVPLAAFGTSAVMAATELRWACYGFARLKIELCIHIVLLACFLIFASTLPEVNEDEDLDGRCKTRIPMLVCCALVGLIGLRMVYTELRSLLRTGVRRYLRSGWNLLDVTIIALLTTVGVYYTNLCMADEVWHADGLPSNTRSLLTVSALLSVALWVRVLYFLLGFKDTGALVRMVIQIIVDMRYFLLLMVMIAIGFGVGFRLLFYSYILSTGELGTPDNSWSNWLRIAANMYTIALGDWDTSEFYNGTSDGNFSILLFALYLLVMVIILLNLLIAIMGDSYDRVKDKEELEFMRGKVKLLMDLESEMESFDLKNHARRADQFVHFMVPSEQVQENEAQEWLGRLKETEKRVRSIVDGSQDRVQETVQALEAKIDELLQARGSGTNSSSRQLAMHTQTQQGAESGSQRPNLSADQAALV